ncbi:hypothetical protein VOLCADRAFT_104941 [Volvox carteri f. nagariensis]|uniref:Ricin B lectin domain-containing protein n=1 Tax=Volvox carteri f. nagariensis TaxID=3068 RepID=D8TXA8_VOLCA|nr:uncharacterized protein VOLCADRAFT_104941 [Volvox carteri f. nagariensis]EFJ47879.1 hypothetical protein VOLCADRAFT_104941 [Volvox carteri f. nagariensis]|eukprot:XP_002950985.1 hypothetical protein VOLCADRAFT_104941 [Volvox carteri f. nagariensis]
MNIACSRMVTRSRCNLHIYLNLLAVAGFALFHLCASHGEDHGTNDGNKPPYPNPPPPPPPPPYPASIPIGAQVIQANTNPPTCLAPVILTYITTRPTVLGQVACSANSNLHHFTLLHTGGGYYRITSEATGLCVTILEGSFPDTEPIYMSPCMEGSFTQEFFLNPLPGPWWTIRPRITPTMCLSTSPLGAQEEQPLEFRVCDGGKMETDRTSRQRFSLPNFQPALAMPKQKVLTSTDSNKCVTVPNGGLPYNDTRLDLNLLQYDCGITNPPSGPNDFFFLATGGGFYRITSSSDIRRCWTVGGRTPTSYGTPVSLMPCVDAAANQEFMLTPQGGRWIFRTKYDISLCVDADANSRNGASIRVWECNGGSAQSFLLPNFQPVLQVVKVSYFGDKCIDSKPRFFVSYEDPDMISHHDSSTDPLFLQATETCDYNCGP